VWTGTTLYNTIREALIEIGFLYVRVFDRKTRLSPSQIKREYHSAAGGAASGFDKISP
jgi:hypothetical protein